MTLFVNFVRRTMQRLKCELIARFALKRLKCCPEVWDVKARLGVTGMIILTAVVDPSARTTLDVDSLERVVSAVGREKKVDLGITIAERPQSKSLRWQIAWCRVFSRNS